MIEVQRDEIPYFKKVDAIFNSLPKSIISSYGYEYKLKIDYSDGMVRVLYREAELNRTLELCLDESLVMALLRMKEWCDVKTKPFEKDKHKEMI